MPSVNQITDEHVVLIKLVPEVGTSVVAVGKLQHIVAGTPDRTEIIAVGEIEVPNGASTEFPVTVFMEKGAELVNVHVGREFTHDHEVYEAWNVYVCRITMADILVMRGDYSLDGVEIGLDVLSLFGSDLFGFRGVIDVGYILPVIVCRCGPGWYIASSKFVGLDDVTS